jgi:hypothetical protein
MLATAQVFISIPGRNVQDFCPKILVLCIHLTDNKICEQVNHKEYSVSVNKTNSAEHSSWDSLITKVDSARDEMGVISPDALRKQLSDLTPDDWRILSTKLYPKNNSNPNGFYIVDENDKNFTIHNDLTKADKFANQSFLKGAWYETKKDALFLMDGGVQAAAAGAFAGGMTGGITGMMVSEALEAGTIGAAIGAGTVAVLFSGALVGTMVWAKASDRKDLAKRDLNDSQSVRMTL